MNKDAFESLLKEVVGHEVEVPVGLVPIRKSGTRLAYAGAIKKLFILACGLILLEQIALIRLFFVNVTAFLLATSFMALTFVGLIWIYYLLRNEMNDFILKLLEGKKYENIR